MDFRNRVYLGGSKSFSQHKFLPANDAADFARASFSRLFKRSLRNSFRRFAVNSKVHKVRGVESDRAVNRSFPRKYLYGIKPANLPRNQSDGAIHSSADSVNLDRVGVLVHPERGHSCPQVFITESEPNASLNIFPFGYLCANVCVFNASLEYAADRDVRAPIIVNLCADVSVFQIWLFVGSSVISFSVRLWDWACGILKGWRYWRFLLHRVRGMRRRVSGRS
jgi:hypothetical protein